MSGWNKKTGLYELTYSQAEYWFRRKDVPQECGQKESVEFLVFITCLLKAHGINVVANHDTWLEVDCLSAGEIWEALSGLPADPERIAHHDRGKPSEKTYSKPNNQK